MLAPLDPVGDPRSNTPTDPPTKTPGFDGAFGPGGPFDLSGVDLSWLMGPGAAVRSAANTAIGYAALAFLGVALIVVSVFVLLKSE